MTSAVATPDLGQLQLLDLSKIEVSELNPRQDVGDLTELAQSIGEIGVLEPIVVVQRNGHYEAIAGSRRLAASRQAGKKQIPARVMSLDEAQQAAAALIENLQRKDLTPLEEAQAYRKYLDLTGVTQKELGQKIGRAPSTISNALRLLEAPAAVQKVLASGKVSAAHARVLLQAKDPGMLDEVVAELKSGVTVDELEERVHELNRDYDSTGPGAVEAAKKALAEAQKKHAGMTIVWSSKATAIYGGYTKLLNLSDALGKSPKRPAGPISQDWNHPGATVHQQICGCKAMELYIEPYASPTRFETRRVCVEPSKYATMRRNGGSLPKAAEKELTPAQRARIEAAERKAIAKQVDQELRVRPGRPKYAPLMAKLKKAAIPADVARAIVAVDVVLGELYQAPAIALAWERVAAMPAKKVTELAASVLASRLEEHLDDNYTGGDTTETRRAIAAYFGVKVAEPKPKKAAKR